MLKALVKKQLAELIAQFLRDRRTGKARGRGSLIALMTLLAVTFIGIAALFFLLGKTLALSLSEETGVLYYFVMGLIAIAVGILGSVFNTYFSVFEAKDNELLLAMPIPPGKIVFSRVISVAVMAALYVSVVLIPAFLARVIYRRVTALVIINHVLLFIFVTAFVLALSLLLGFAVAAVARKVKRKSLVTVTVSIAVVALYYFAYFKAQEAIMRLIALTSVPNAIKKGMFLFYHMGLAAEGDPLSMLIFAAVSSAFLVLSYLMLSRSFLRFATAKRSFGGAKKGKISVSGLGASLLKRELKRFASSPNYILNCAFGSLMMIVAGVFLFIKGADIRPFTVVVGQLLPKSEGLIIAAAIVCLLSSGNILTAPSITLEGNRIWILRSLPVTAWQVFLAKISMHLVLTLPPFLFVWAAAVYAIGASVLSAVFMLLLGLAFVLFSAEYGLTLNLIKPALDWNSEIVAIKQSPSVLITVFSEYFMVMGLAALYLPLANVMWDGYYLLIIAGVFAAADVGLYFWLKLVGTKKFEALG